MIGKTGRRKADTKIKRFNLHQIIYTEDNKVKRTLELDRPSSATYWVSTVLKLLNI